MSGLNRHQVEELLRIGKPPQPPEDLAQRIKGDIPEALAWRPAPMQSEPRQVRWLLVAAGFFAAVGGGFLGLRVLQEPPPRLSVSEAPGNVAEAKVSRLPASPSEGHQAGAPAPGNAADREALEPAQPNLSGVLESPPALKLAEATAEARSRDRAKRQTTPPVETSVDLPVAVEASAATASDDVQKSMPRALEQTEQKEISALPISEQTRPPGARSGLARMSVEEFAASAEAPPVADMAGAPQARASSSEAGAIRPASGIEEGGVDSFLNTERFPLSTLTLSSGHGSFATARQSLLEGRYPPPETVRIDAFINAFDEGAGLRGKALFAEGAPALFAESEQHYLLRLHLDPTVTTVASRLEVRFDASLVEGWRLFGSEPGEQRRPSRHPVVVATVAVAEQGLAQGMTALYELRLRQKPSPDAKIATLSLAGAAEPSLREQLVTGADFADSWRGSARSLRLASLAAAFAEALREGAGAPAGKIDQISRLTRQMATTSPADADVTELADLVERLVRLQARAQVPR